MKKRRLEILHEDEAIIVVDKPAGLLSIPDRYTPDIPHVVSILEMLGRSALIVHRLDRDTSGVMVLAKDAKSHTLLNDLFQNGTVAKTYMALVNGAMSSDRLTIELPLLPDGDRRHRTIVDRQRGKTALTVVRNITRFRDYSLVEAMPETGRTHQIRVHLAATGTPIACDSLYGDGKPILLSAFKARYSPGRREERPLLARQGLHASKLRFMHPETQQEVEYELPLPRDMKATVNQLGKHAGFVDGSEQLPEAF